MTEFLALPIQIILGFVALAIVSTVLDYVQPGVLRPLRARIVNHVFGDAAATSGLIGTIAGSVITVTSITFSLLLLAVQQSAAALTPLVYDQFLRRRVNQVCFGFFVGLALYALLVLATIDPPYNPVFGATMALLLTLFALLLIVLLLYTTINQMRPVVVIEAIHDHVLRAEEAGRPLLRCTRRDPEMEGGASSIVCAADSGYLVRIDEQALRRATERNSRETEIVLRISIGAFASIGDPIAEIRTRTPEDVDAVAKDIVSALHLERQRDIDTDAAYGIEQLAHIGWTSVSTAKSNPSPGLLVVRSLRDLAARWSLERKEDPSGPPLPVVYPDDLVRQLFDAFETLAVVASESMQHQTFAEILRALTVLASRLPPAQQARIEDLLMRALTGMGDQILTADLDAALTDAAAALRSIGRAGGAARISAAQAELRRTVGTLASRSTRVPARRE
jgi:uncharacterized membrane protein